MSHQPTPDAVSNDPSTRSILDRLEQLNTIGKALSAKRDVSYLLEEILVAAKKITNADGGTLYRVVNHKYLKFEILHNDSLGIVMGGTSGVAIPFSTIPLYDEENGKPNDSMVVACAVLQDRTINIPDAYVVKEFDLSGTRNFDQKTGYRSQSFLTIPMKDHEHEIIGVLQLINAREPVSVKIVPFSKDDQGLAESLASQAAIALTNQALMSQLEQLFESFILLINTAIDDKSPYTGGHCARVPELTMMLAEAVSKQEQGIFSDFQLTESDRKELHIAALLHDCGKITTPVHVVDKATKLETISDRIELVDARFEIIRRELEIRSLQQQLQSLRQMNPQPPDSKEDSLPESLRQLLEDQTFLHKCNTGGEFMAPDLQRRVDEIAARYTWVDKEGNLKSALSPDEVYNLKIQKGTLTAEERDIINHHVVASINMLNALHWPKHLRHVPEYAGGHHERMDGKGYPNGLTRDQMSIQARIMAIADIFEALTARDRPYKPGKKLSESLFILGKMKQDHHIDPDLFDIFISEGVYQQYAEKFLPAEQMDAVDLSKIPGYTPSRSVSESFAERRE